mgnify:CR=1 FL=1
MYWLTGLLGVLLIIAPWVMGYGDNQTAAWTCVVLGVAAVVVSACKPLLKDASNWEFWAAGIIGVLAIIAPWVMGFSAHVTATWTTVVLGVVLAILAGYEIFREKPAGEMRGAR